MTEFFEGVGGGDNAGVWEDVPSDRSTAFRKKFAAKNKIAKNAVDAGEAVGT
jgi:chlorophyllide a reductase subunit Y